jgi:hypothetical protein
LKESGVPYDNSNNNTEEEDWSLHNIWSDQSAGRILSTQ